MWTHGVATVAGKSDDLTLRHRISDFDVDLRKMQIKTHDAQTVVNNDCVAMIAAMMSAPFRLAARERTNPLRELAREG